MKAAALVVVRVMVGPRGECPETECPSAPTLPAPSTPRPGFSDTTMSLEQRRRGLRGRLRLHYQLVRGVPPRPQHADVAAADAMPAQVVDAQNVAARGGRG